MSAYLAVYFTSKGPSFATLNTVAEAHAHLNQLISQRPLQPGDRVVIVTVDTDEVVYTHRLSRTKLFFESIAHGWSQARQMIENGLAKRETV